MKAIIGATMVKLKFCTQTFLHKRMSTAKYSTTQHNTSKIMR